MLPKVTMLDAGFCCWCVCVSLYVWLKCFGWKQWINTLQTEFTKYITEAIILPCETGYHTAASTIWKRKIKGVCVFQYVGTQCVLIQMTDGAKMKPCKAETHVIKIKWI